MAGSTRGTTRRAPNWAVIGRTGKVIRITTIPMTRPRESAVGGGLARGSASEIGTVIGIATGIAIGSGTVNESGTEGGTGTGTGTERGIETGESASERETVTASGIKSARGAGTATTQTMTSPPVAPGGWAVAWAEAATSRDPICLAVPAATRTSTAGASLRRGTVSGHERTGGGGTIANACPVLLRA